MADPTVLTLEPKPALAADAALPDPPPSPARSGRTGSDGALGGSGMSMSSGMSIDSSGSGTRSGLPNGANVGANVGADRLLRRVLLGLVFCVAMYFGKSIWFSISTANADTLSSYVLTDDDTPVAGCHHATCSFATTQVQPLTERAIRLPAKLQPAPTIRLPLPPNFNRSFALAADTSNARDFAARLSGTSYRLNYIWWAGSQRFAFFDVTGPGYLSALLPADGSAAVPISHFISGNQGFHIDSGRTEAGPAPFDFAQAEFQPVTTQLSVVADSNRLAGLSRGDVVEFGSNLAALIEHRRYTLAGAVEAIRPIAGDANRSQIDLRLTDDVRALWEQILLTLASSSTGSALPSTIDLALPRTGGQRDGEPAASGQFQWLPQQSVQVSQEQDNGATVGTVWAVIDQAAIPIRVVIGDQQNDRVAVLEMPLPGMLAAVAYDQWARLTTTQRQSVLRAVIVSDTQNRHLRPGVPILSSAPSTLLAGSPAGAVTE